ncbi:MAG: hypothetical protein IJM15_09075 [Erysipelotrichaceae bacterium]|nr:hypothetical protein [Erysipelotrichaceae bacterium]
MKTMRAYAIALLPLIIIAAALVLYFLFYKRSINRSLNDPDGYRRRSFISPSELTLGVIVIFLLISNYHNRATINQLSMQLYNINSSISDLTYQIEQLKQDDSHRFDYYMRAVSVEKDANDRYHADIEITVEPEVITDNTSVTLYVDGKTINLNNNEIGRFTANFEITPAKLPESCYLIVHFVDGDVREELPMEPEKLFNELFPMMQIMGSSEINSGKLNLDLDVWFPDEKFSSTLIETEVCITNHLTEVLYEQKLTPNENGDPIKIKYRGKVDDEKDLHVFIRTTDSKGWHYITQILSPSSEPDWDPSTYTVVDENGVIVLAY